VTTGSSRQDHASGLADLAAEARALSTAAEFGSLLNSTGNEEDSVAHTSADTAAIIASMLAGCGRAGLRPQASRAVFPLSRMRLRNALADTDHLLACSPGY
jgi:hypothetical protein